MLGDRGVDCFSPWFPIGLRGGIGVERGPDPTMGANRARQDVALQLHRQDGNGLPGRWHGERRSASSPRPSPLPASAAG